MDRLHSLGCKDFLSNTTTLESPILPDVCLHIARLSSYDGLVFCALCILYVLFNRLLMVSPLLKFTYGEKYTSMKEANQCTFRLRHIGILARTTSFLLISKPALMVAFRNKAWYEPYSQGSNFTLGDATFFSVMITAAFHLFELIFDQSLKPLLVVHHLGSLFIIQGFIPTVMGLPQTEYLQLNNALGMLNVTLYWGMY